MPIVTQLSDINNAGPTTYVLNRPAGTTISVSDGYMSLAIGQDTDYWYIQTVTGPWSIGFLKSSLPFDDYRFSAGSGIQQYAIRMKDSDNALVLQLSDTSYQPGMATLIVPKTRLDFNLPYQ